MSNPKGEKVEINPATTQHPPPASEKQPFGEADLSASRMGTGAPPSMPPQCQASYATPGAAFNQGLVLQPAQTIFVSLAQPVHEPDYLAYSISTLICCFLPVGIAAVVYSVNTREANRSGNSMAARQYSKLALILSHTALGLGILLVIVDIIIVSVLMAKAVTVATDFVQKAEIHA
ncbi:interferon-induced transmembrane protein 3-like [Varanus komodoensis]|uniref:interferon-induced transmembrane protein 3-like n=1 Tax=Varanus komodoensis TaxID=61221 RepID=UPI001CF7BC0C|nr:interferon-induced transmembrane protein 3-like [Varanus komodoensis]